MGPGSWYGIEVDAAGACDSTFATGELSFNTVCPGDAFEVLFGSALFDFARERGGSTAE